MKPVVSSLVALAIAVAPLSAFAAKPAHKTAHAHVAKTGHKADKTEKVAKGDKGEKSPIVQVRAPGKPGKQHGAIKPVVHHAHNVDLSGGGHSEPSSREQGKEHKAEAGKALVAASMITKVAHAKPAHGKPGKAAAKPVDGGELPKLPAANAGKPSKGGAEKGARKPASQKSETRDAANDEGGEPARDEDTAELVARIRGIEPSAKTAKNVAHSTPTPKVTPPPCVKDPVEIVRGPEMARFELTRCDGTLAPLAVENLSIMIRPGGAARPTAPVAELAKKPGNDLAPGIRRVDPRLVERIQAMADHFGKPGAPAKMFVISGYRPASVGSMHSTGRAVDFRLDGVKNEDVVAFCKTLTDTGCGYYPNSSFVHVDVRDAGAGHVTWIDASGPGETPRYVQSWPPSAPAESKPLHRTSLLSRSDEEVTAKSLEELAKEGESLLRARRPIELGNDALDEHPAEAAQKP